LDAAIDAAEAQDEHDEEEEEDEADEDEDEADEEEEQSSSMIEQHSASSESAALRNSADEEAYEAEMNARSAAMLEMEAESPNALAGIEHDTDSHGGDMRFARVHGMHRARAQQH
jgi:hypothetical protein